MRNTEKKLKQEEKEQLQLLSSEMNRNKNLESQINAKEKFAEKLHNAIKEALSLEENIRSEVHAYYFKIKYILPCSVWIKMIM